MTDTAPENVDPAAETPAPVPGAFAGLFTKLWDAVFHVGQARANLRNQLGARSNDPAKAGLEHAHSQLVEAHDALHTAVTEIAGPPPAAVVNATGAVTGTEPTADEETVPEDAAEPAEETAGDAQSK
jgi:hypothetical protein